MADLDIQATNYKLRDLTFPYEATLPGWKRDLIDAARNLDPDCNILASFAENSLVQEMLGNPEPPFIYAPLVRPEALPENATGVAIARFNTKNDEYRRERHKISTLEAIIIKSLDDPTKRR